MLYEVITRLIRNIFEPFSYKQNIIKEFKLMSTFTIHPIVVGSKLFDKA